MEDIVGKTCESSLINIEKSRNPVSIIIIEMEYHLFKEMFFEKRKPA